MHVVATLAGLLIPTRFAFLCFLEKRKYAYVYKCTALKKRSEGYDGSLSDVITFYP